MTRSVAALSLVLMPGIALAQAVTAHADVSGASATMVRAAGMPLQDGALPPGELTVRVVRGAFTEDLSGIAVDVHLGDGQAKRALTDAEGRAHFAHLPIGTDVQASAVADGESLVSQRFAVPAESGLRVLLVTGASTGAPADASAPAAFAGASPVSRPPAAAPQTSSGVVGIRVAFAMTTLFAFGLILFQRRPRR